MNSNEIKVSNFIATHSKSENYLNNIARHMKISKSNVMKALKNLLKNGIIMSAGKVERKEIYLLNPDKRGLIEWYFSNLFSNLVSFERILNENLDQIKNKPLFTRKELFFWEYKSKKIEKILNDTFQIIDSIFGMIGSLPFLQIAGFIESNDENNSKIQDCQNQTYKIINKLIYRLKKEHPEDLDILDSIIFLNVKLVSQIMFMEGKAA